MKVLILTDSLSLPRKHTKGVVAWEEIYCSKLRKHFPEIEFVLVAMGGATIHQLYLALNYYTLVYPDMVILQSGIVDCAPRALSLLEQQVIIRFHLFRFVRPFTKFLRKYRKISYTTPKKFTETLLKIKEKFAGKPLVALGILPGCKEYDAIVPGVTRRIELYNSILAANCYFIDNTDFPREGIISDHHHMNKEGHDVIFNKLVKAINDHLYNGNYK